MKRSSNKKVSNEYLSGQIGGLTKTVDSLATATARGFENVDKRFDVIEKTADERFKLIINRFEHLESDIADIKRTLGPLLKIVAEQEREVDDLKLRVARLEEKVGLKR